MLVGRSPLDAPLSAAMKPEKFLNEQGFWILDLAFLKQIFCLIRLASLDPGADSDAENWTSPGRGCGRGGCPMVCRGIHWSFDTNLAKLCPSGLVPKLCACESLSDFVVSVHMGGGSNIYIS